MAEVALTVEGQMYQGWTSASVRWALDELVPAFALEYFDRWSEAREPWRIIPDDECILYVDDEPLFSGYVVSSDAFYDATTSRLNVQGASKTHLLEKCSAAHKSGQWRNQPFATIVQDLISPFGIDAVIDSSVPSDKIARFELEEGEKAASAIERLCRMLAATLTSNADGALVIGRSGGRDTGRQRLRLPVPISRSTVMSNAERYSDYLSKGQLAATDNFYGQETVTQAFLERDEGVRLFCPRLVEAEGPGGRKFLEARAKFERNVRYGRSRTVSLQFLGVRDLEGTLMAPGSLVFYRDPHLGVSGDFVVESLDVELSGDGFLSTLTLVPPETYDVLDLPQSAWRQRR